MSDDKRAVPPFTWSNSKTTRTKHYHRYLDDLEVDVDAEQIDDSPAYYTLIIKAKNGHRDNPRMTSTQVLEVFQVVTLMMGDFERGAVPPTHSEDEVE